MSSKKKKSIDIIDTFGDDFEVSYEEETPITYTLEPTPHPKKAKKMTGPNVVNVNSDPIYTPRPAHIRSSKRFYDIDLNKYFDDDSKYNAENADVDSIHRHSSRKSNQKKLTPIAAPIKKSTKAAYDLFNTLLRNLSLVLILVIIAYIGINFFKGSLPYGNIEEELKTQTFSYTMISYFSIAAILILYELFSALWTMSKARVKDQYGRHREDVGRGLFSFIFIYLCSYASFLLSSHIPATNDTILGIQGALTVFGAMHNVLFGICIAGVISCLLRKYHL